MNNYATHIIRNISHRGDGSAADMSQLIRAVGGMIIAARDGNRVGWGEDPARQEHRIFMDVPSARRFLRRLANNDQAVIKGTVCRSCAMIPSESITCDESNDGAHRLEYSATARIEEVDGDSRVLKVQ